MPHPPCTTPRPLPAAVLDRLAREIAEGHTGDGHATLVRARPGPRGVDVGLCALPERVHPCDALLGHVVPPRWAASGVVAPARARSLDRADDAGTATTVVVLVGRDGHVTSHAVGVDGLEAGGEAPVGRIPDLLHRTLGLPTPPPTVSAAEWWRACWLDALVAAAAVDPTHRPDPGRPLTSTLPEALVQALVDEPGLCTVAGWGRIRELAAQPQPPAEPGPAAVRASVVPFVEPAHAAWFDDGCFARWMLDALPAVDELLDLVSALVPADLLDLLHHVAGRDGTPAPRPARGGDHVAR